MMQPENLSVLVVDLLQPSCPASCRASTPRRSAKASGEYVFRAGDSARPGVDGRDKPGHDATE